MSEQVFHWQIYVPKNDPKGNKYILEYHRAWDNQVRSVAGGLTIYPPAIGQWVDPTDNELIREPVIPVQVACTREQMEQIADITAVHYSQRAVMFYCLSDTVVVIHYENGNRLEKNPTKPDFSLYENPPFVYSDEDCARLAKREGMDPNDSEYDD